MNERYSGTPVGGFPTPPREAVDRTGRMVQFCHLEDFEALVEMYLAFDPADKAQGIPPSNESAIREWLQSVTTADSINIVARYDGQTVGHAMVVGDDSHELAIFVLQSYQGVSIGTELLRTTLGMAASSGIEYVWLTVERWNEPAIALYTKLGFEPLESPSFEREMHIQLATDD